MLHHIWGVRSPWESSASMAMLSVDYQNAFPSLSHAFIQSVPEYVCLPVAFVCLVMQPLRCDYQFFVWASRLSTLSYSNPLRVLRKGTPFHH